MDPAAGDIFFYCLSLTAKKELIMTLWQLVSVGGATVYVLIVLSALSVAIADS